MTDPVGTALSAILFAVAAAVLFTVLFYDRAKAWLGKWLDGRRYP